MTKLTKEQNNKNSDKNGKVDICVWRQSFEQSRLEQSSPTTEKQQHILNTSMYQL